MPIVLDLTHDKPPAFHPVGEAEINGHQLELGRTSGTHRPIIIDWRSQRAWIGDWEDLAQEAYRALNKEEVCDAD